MTNISSKAALNASTEKSSCKNALKSGIYANKLMEGEDPQVLQETINALVRDFDITTSIGYQLSQELAQVMLRMSRAERWQCELIAAHMAKYKTRVEFASQLNLNVLAVDKFPEWYFNDSQEERGRAQLIHSAYLELHHLIENHSADLMMRVKSELPDLWWYVMGASEAVEKVHTFPGKLSSYSTKTDPVYRLKDLQDHMIKKHLHEILWAQSEDRYEAVIFGLRAQVQMELAANPNLQRGETHLHRRKSDLIAQLMQLARESQTVQLSTKLRDSGSAQVITYKPSSQESSLPGAAATGNSKETTQPGA